MKPKIPYVSYLLLLMTAMPLTAQVSIIADQTEGCDSVTVQFDYSASGITVTTLYWDFGNGETSSSLDPDPVVYVSPGTYDITLVVNGDVENLIVERDFINVYRTVTADFTFRDTLDENDYTLVFEHQEQSFTPGADYTFLWDFDDGTTSDERHPVHQFPYPGTFEVSLTVADDLGCSDMQQQTVTIEGDIREQYIIASATEGCDSLKVKFSFTGDTDTITSVEWDFGNGETGNSLNPDTVSYIQPGQYTVQFTINGITSDPVVINDFITVRRSIRAFFDVNNLEGEYNYSFTHIDQPFDTNATYEFLWWFSDGETRSGQREVIRTFPDTGIYSVSLTINDSYGCTDKRSQQVFVFDEIRMPNVFTPNEDGHNDYFIIRPVSDDIILSINIYNRNGILVWSMEAPVIMWDGRTDNGVPLSSGVYYYVLEATEGDNQGLYNKSGIIHLFAR